MFYEASSQAEKEMPVTYLVSILRARRRILGGGLNEGDLSCMK
jgi:hypothetical protein